MTPAPRRAALPVILIVAGAAVSGPWPDPTAWAGIMLICGAGPYILWRAVGHNKMRNPAVPVGDI